MSDHDPFREKKLSQGTIQLPEKPLGQLLIPEAVKMDPLRAESYKVAPYRDLRFPEQQGEQGAATAPGSAAQPQAIHTSVFEPVKFPPLEQTLQQQQANQHPKVRFFQSPLGKLIAFLFGISAHRQKNINSAPKNHHVTRRLREQLSRQKSSPRVKRS